MVFSSIAFLFYFLPCVLLFYFAAPKALKNTVLLLFSLLFYAWGEPKYVFLMLLTVLVNFFGGLLIEKYRGKLLGKIVLILCVVFCLGALGYFKYANFFIENFSRITGIAANTLQIALPIGISFYSFQILSYTVDVYRGDVRAQKNPITLATYVSFFPQLIAGPIVRYIDVQRELKSRTHSWEMVAVGARRFIIGLSKKVLLANTLGELGAAFLQTNEKAILFYWLYATSYMLQVYFDFSGYSDMAIGLGKIFGFHFPENFRYPLYAKSITAFWRRWHISLGSWFRDYVYIPLGGNRVKRGRMLFNIFVVWFLTGFWHGAEWNFIIWGLYFGVLLTLEKFFFVKRAEASKVWGHLYVLFTTIISFGIFSAGSLSEALSCVGGMFGKGGLPLVSDAFFYHIRSYAFVLLLAAFAATPASSYLFRKLSARKWFEKAMLYMELPLLLVLLLLTTAYLADGAFNPFLYFRF